MTDTMTSPLVVASSDEVGDVTFDRSMEAQIRGILKRYPDAGAALLPVLWLCQDRWGWISPGIMEAVGQRLDLAPAFVEGVVSFYTMYQRRPTGKYLLQVCTTLSCQLCDTSALVDHLKQKLNIDFGETSADGLTDIGSSKFCEPVLQGAGQGHPAIAEVHDRCICAVAGSESLTCLRISGPTEYSDGGLAPVEAGD